MPSSPVIAAVTLPFLGELVALFALSGLIAYLCFRIRLAPIVGYLITGAIIGPFAFGVVEDVELVNYLAEIGVILLLFTIGVEFSLEELKGIGGFILSGGGLQVGSTAALTVGVLAVLGVDWQTAVFTGCLVALSSTAIVLGLLSDRAETDTPSGKLSLGILIFQDFAIIAMVLLVPLLSGEGSGFAIVWVLVRALLIISGVIVLARIVVPKILGWVAETRRQELFLLVVVALCFGTAWLTSLFGVSLALGAFLAGLIVSESRYREHALSEILPLRTIFTAVFFVSVGMLFNIGFILEHPFITFGIAAAVLIVKFILTSGSILALGYPARTAFISGLSLAQIGEFSFVLQRAGQEVGLTPAGLGEIGDQGFIAVAVLLMVATPFLMEAAPSFGTRLAGILPFKRDAEPTATEEDAFEDHVIVVGFGPAGKRLVQVLRNTKIPFIVVELNPNSVDEAMKDGIPVLYGDATRLAILEAACIHKAKTVVVAINDRDATLRIVRLARHENPTLQIFARTRFLAEVERLQEAGADVVIPEELETSVRLFSNVLNAYMIPPEEVAKQVNLIRADDYGIIRGSIQEAHMMVLQGLDEEGLHTRAVAVREGSKVVGKSLEELELRKRYGLTVLAVRRSGRTIGSPSGSFRLQAGDRLVLIGMADQFVECSDL
ncbi:MAG: cation:proton antiporter, partial [Rhodothermales bacterium]